MSQNDNVPTADADRIELPILFTPAMIARLLCGAKTVTRRPVRGHPPKHYTLKGLEEDGGRCFAVFESKRGPDVRSLCPLGNVGAVLYLRETYWQAGSWQRAHYSEDDDHSRWSGSPRIFYAANGDPPNEPNDDYPNGLRNGAFSAANPNRIWRKRPSIHMPQWASRRDMVVTSLSMQRLHDIDPASVAAEGVDPGEHPIRAFRDVWNAAYGGGGDAWRHNRYVWVGGLCLLPEPSPEEAEARRRRGWLSDPGPKKREKSRGDWSDFGQDEV